MTKTLKPHYLLILISTLKMIVTLLIFFAVSVSLSPNKYYSAINLIKLLIPLAVLIYAYIFYFWHSITIEITDEKLDFNMTAGRKNHIEVLYTDIAAITLKKGFFEKIFNLSRISITIKDVEKTYGGKIMVLDQYMVFKTPEAEEIKEVLSKHMNNPLKNIPEY